MLGDPRTAPPVKDGEKDGYKRLHDMLKRLQARDRYPDTNDSFPVKDEEIKDLREALKKALGDDGVLQLAVCGYPEEFEAKFKEKWEDELQKLADMLGVRVAAFTSPCGVGGMGGVPRITKKLSETRQVGYWIIKTPSAGGQKK
jgi:hypothetical protein